jgi:hypothetical protein
VQGGERTGQPEQDRHGHLRQFQLQVQVSGFKTISQLYRLIILHTIILECGDRLSCVFGYVLLKFDFTAQRKEIIAYW